MEPINFIDLCGTAKSLYAYVPVVNDASEDYIGDTIHVSMEIYIGKGQTFPSDGHGNWLVTFTDGVDERTVSLVKTPVYRLDEEAPDKETVERLHEEVKDVSGSIIVVDQKIHIER